MVATLPTMPAWAATFDPDGAHRRGLDAAHRRSLRRPDSLLIDGRALGWDDTHFADPVHVILPHHTAFTEFIADARPKRHRRPRDGG